MQDLEGRSVFMVEGMAEKVVAFIKTVIPPDFMVGLITILPTCLVEVQVSYTDKIQEVYRVHVWITRSNRC